MTNRTKVNVHDHNVVITFRRIDQSHPVGGRYVRYFMFLLPMVSRAKIAVESHDNTIRVRDTCVWRQELSFLKTRRVILPPERNDFRFLHSYYYYFLHDDDGYRFLKHIKILPSWPRCQGTGE